MDDLIRQFSLNRSSTVFNALSADLRKYGADKLTDALTRAAEADNQGGISINFYRAFLSRSDAAVPKANKSAAGRSANERVYEDDRQALPKWMLEKLNEMDVMQQ